MKLKPGQELDRLARRLARADGRSALPSLYYIYDPQRSPDPLTAARALPRGAAFVFRHFGAPDRATTAHRLRALTRRRGLLLLIGADATLAHRIGADGVHWPERMISRARRARGLNTAAAHSGAALARAAKAGMDAAFLSPVFPSRSASAQAPLGPLKAGRLARSAQLPVMALGGVTAKTARRLLGRGFKGLAAVEGFVGPR